MPRPVLAFDIFGTLLDTGGIARALSAHCETPAAATAVAARWRDKQLEYTFRRTAAGQYAPFFQCTREALDFVCAEAALHLSETQRQELMNAYRRLPPFADAAEGLAAAKKSGAQCWAFSNGEKTFVAELLQNANLQNFFQGVVSADAVQKFKPAGQVYEHFLQTANCAAADAVLISSNPFDIIGAQAAGWRAIWLRRNNAPFDPWSDTTPPPTIKNLTALPPLL